MLYNWFKPQKFKHFTPQSAHSCHFLNLFVKTPTSDPALQACWLEFHFFFYFFEVLTEAPEYFFIRSTDFDKNFFILKPIFPNTSYIEQKCPKKIQYNFYDRLSIGYSTSKSLSDFFFFNLKAFNKLFITSK